MPTPNEEEPGQEKAEDSGLNWDAMQYYKKDLQSEACRPLSREEEQQLVLRYKNGDETAGERIITSNLPFVFKIARRSQGYGVPIGDLIQEGNRALSEVLPNFDPQRGSFITYAKKSLKRAMAHAIDVDRAGGRGLTDTELRNIKRFDTEWNRFWRERGEQPTDEEMAQLCDWSVRKTQRVRQAWLDYSQRPVSRDEEPFWCDAQAASGDLTYNEVAYNEQELDRRIQYLLEQLTSKQKELLEAFAKKLAEGGRTTRSEIAKTLMPKNGKPKGKVAVTRMLTERIRPAFARELSGDDNAGVLQILRHLLDLLLHDPQKGGIHHA